MPTVGHLTEAIREGTKDWPTALHIIQNEDDKFAAFDTADAALAASGTVTSELALSHTPMVVGYRMGWLTFLLVAPLFNARYITLINLVLDREAIPEFIQYKCTATRLADALRPYLTEAEPGAAQIAAIDEALAALGEGEEPPSFRAARAVIELAARPAS